VASANQTLCLHLIELKFFCATLCVLLCMEQIEISKIRIAVVLSEKMVNFGPLTKKLYSHMLIYLTQVWLFPKFLALNLLQSDCDVY